MTIYLHSNGQQVAEVINLKNHGKQQWSFSCRPPIFDVEGDYEIYPSGGKPMRIMISNLTSDGMQSQIEAVEL